MRQRQAADQPSEQRDCWRNQPTGGQDHSRKKYDLGHGQSLAQQLTRVQGAIAGAVRWAALALPRQVVRLNVAPVCSVRFAFSGYGCYIPCNGLQIVTARLEILLCLAPTLWQARLPIAVQFSGSDLVLRLRRMIGVSGQLNLEPQRADTRRILIARAVRDKCFVCYVQSELALLPRFAHIERVFACEPFRFESNVLHNDFAAHLAPVATRTEPGRALRCTSSSGGRCCPLAHRNRRGYPAYDILRCGVLADALHSPAMRGPLHRAHSSPRWPVPRRRLILAQQIRSRVSAHLPDRKSLAQTSLDIPCR